MQLFKEKPFYIRHAEYLAKQHMTGMPPIGLTFEDVLVQPAHSTIPSRQSGHISLNSHVVGDVYVNAPIMTANMDTITEWRMAQEIALLGGVGVIHRYLSSDEQARQVKIVKEKTRTLQDKPFSVHPDATIRDMRRLQKELKTGYFLVQDTESNLLGIVTDIDMETTEDVSTQAFNIMTPRDRLITVPAGTTLEEAEKIMKANRIKKVPVMSSEGRVVGVYTRKDAELVRKYPYASRDNKGKLIVGGAIGVKDIEAEVERAYKLVDAGVDFIIIDIAHGDSENMKRMLKRLIKENIPVPIIAGNIATSEAAKALIGEGARGLKVGIGPGWACDTRVVAGVGRAQISTIASVAAVAVKNNIAVIADGGMRNPGDLVKALVAGADIGMFGGMFAGTEETPGKKIIRGRKFYKRYEGMASDSARRRAKNALNTIQTIGSIYEDRYSETEEGEEQDAPEGREKEVPYRGPAKEVFIYIRGGVRSGMSYINAYTIPEMREKGELERITQAGAVEQYGDII